MAKIAYINIPAHGHTNPTLPVVRELVTTGHHVMYYNAEEFRDKIVPTGAEFCPYEKPMPTTKEISERMKSMIDASLVMIEMSENQTAWMVEELRYEQPDLIIYDSTCMWGYIASRMLNIPSICSITHFVLDGSVSHLPKLTMLRYILTAIPKLPRIIQWKRTMNQQFGKEHVGGITEYADLNLVFTSEEFHPDNDFIDERFHFVGSSIDITTRNDSNFKVTNDTTTVYISLGTINNLNLAFYRTVFEAFEDYPAYFILSVGANTQINQLQPIPDNFAVYPYVPQLQVLQQVDVFITHGGMNSVHEGLYYGVPEIVIPQQMEQLLNGLRIRAVGAGILLGERPPYGQVTAQELHSALEIILADDTYRTNAKYYGKTLHDAGGYKNAVEEIEAYLKSYQTDLRLA
ncbi:MAG: macrolide family glycosyltransferase [Phototrophicaceae bacterium]